MSTEWRHRPSLQALISRKQRKMIIAKSRLMTIAILGAIFGQTKKASPQPLPQRLPFIHIFDNSQHLTFAEEIVKSCFESCISWT